MEPLSRLECRKLRHREGNETGQTSRSKSYVDDLSLNLKLQYWSFAHFVNNNKYGIFLDFYRRFVYFIHSWQADVSEKVSKIYIKKW